MEITGCAYIKELNDRKLKVSVCFLRERILSMLPKSSGKGIIEDTVSKCEGDVFHAFTEKMRFSYNELTDKANLIWVEFK